MVEGNISQFFLTGLWPKEKEVLLPPNSVGFGIRFKILAPEYIFDYCIASILGQGENVNLDFWNVGDFNFESLELVAEQYEKAILAALEQNRNQITEKKLELSRLLYGGEGDFSVKHIAEKINWNARDINRYLNKYLGVSLKAYLNIQKVYSAYLHIRKGEFFPEKGYFDQAHFIREIKKHTGETPRGLYQGMDDRFIQLKNIQKK